MLRHGQMLRDRQGLRPRLALGHDFGQVRKPNANVIFRAGRQSGNLVLKGRRQIDDLAYLHPVGLGSTRHSKYNQHLSMKL